MKCLSINLLFIYVFLFYMSACKQVSDAYQEQKNFRVYKHVQNGKYGFMDSTGKIIITHQFDNTLNFYEGMAAFSENNKWGFIRQDGKIVVPAQFEFAENFRNGRALVLQNNQFGFINKEGKVVIPLQYSAALSFSDQSACVQLNSGQWIYIGVNGEKLFDQSFSYAEPFSEGLALVKENDQYKYIDQQGSVKVSPQCDYAEAFSEGLALIGFGNFNDYNVINHQFKFINKKGQVVIDSLECHWASNFKDRVAIYAIGSGKNLKMGLIDTKGKPLTEAVFASNDGLMNMHFKDGLSKFGAYFEVDENGNYLRLDEFDDKKTNNLLFLYGYIDASGQEVIPPQYSSADEFYQGLALIEKDGAVFYINKKGEKVGTNWEF